MKCFVTFRYPQVSPGCYQRMFYTKCYADTLEDACHVFRVFLEEMFPVYQKFQFGIQEYGFDRHSKFYRDIGEIYLVEVFAHNEETLNIILEDL